MCKSKAKGGDGGAAAREAERQANITKGYDQIQRIFGGYKEGIDPATDLVEGQTYYGADGAPVTYSAATAPSGSLFSGVKENAGFDDNFYNSRAKAYVDYATPQLEDQYTEAVKNLTYALSRNGQLNSSVRGDEEGKLLKKYNQEKTGIADKGLSYANQARSNVEGARSDLVSLNNNVANPTTIANEAASRLAGLQAADTYSPLAPLFQNIGEGLGTQAELERRSSAKYNTGLFTPAAVSGGQSSARTIR